MTERENMEITDEMLVGYREYLRDEKRSQATVEKYLRDVKTSVNYFGTGWEVDREEVRDYRETLRERYKITNANSVLAALNSSFMFARWKELKVKLCRVQRAMYSRKELEMTEKGYEKLIRAARKDGNEKMSMLIQTIGSTEVRISELKSITMETLETGRAEICNKGKSRVILLPMGLTRLLKKYYKSAEIRTGSIFIIR